MSTSSNSRAAETAALQRAPAVDFVDPRATSFVELKSRRRLPHLYKEGGSYFVTFRLFDAIVPPEERAQRKAFGQKHEETREEIAARTEPPLRLGSCALANPEIAAMVQKTVQHFHGDRYFLHAWCVMSNHVHAVYTAMGERSPKDVHHSWKSYSAHQANMLLAHKGVFWEVETFDHLIRSVEDLEWFVEYTENNPVAAGLCEKKSDWPWSSAGCAWNDDPTCSAAVPAAPGMGAL